MTVLRKLTFFILLILILIIITIAYRAYYLGAILFLILIGIAFKWYNLLTEEMIVLHLMRDGKRNEINEIQVQFGKKANRAIKNLEEKKIIKKHNGNVELMIDDYNFSMTKWRK